MLMLRGKKCIFEQFTWLLLAQNKHELTRLGYLINVIGSINIESKEAQPWFAPTGEIFDFWLSLLAKTVSIFLWFCQK